MTAPTASNATAPKPVRIGVAGLGRAFFNDYMPVLRAPDSPLRLIAVCDLAKERRDLVEREFSHVRTYRRLDDMLDDPEIDVVLDSLPTDAAMDFAMDSLGRGRWTLCELPLAKTEEQAMRLRAASQRAKGRLLPLARGSFSPEFLLARSALGDARLGEVFEVRLCRHDWIRRNDWQSLSRCHGGSALCDGVDAMIQAAALLDDVPARIWGELKRTVSCGDADDTMHAVLKSRGRVTVDIDICNGLLPPYPPAITVRGTHGVLEAACGKREGTMRFVSSSFAFSRRRTCIHPGLDDMHEEVPIETATVSLPNEVASGMAGVFGAVCATVNRAEPFPTTVDGFCDAVKYIGIVSHL